MGRGGDIAKAENAGQAKQSVGLGIDRQRGDRALALCALAIKPGEIDKAATGFYARKRMYAGEITLVRLPLRAVPPLRFFAQKMTTARELIAQNFHRNQRARQSHRSPEHNPKFRAVSGGVHTMNMSIFYPPR